MDQNSTTSQAQTKWYQKGWVIALLIVFFFPVGLFLMWRYTKWDRAIKGLISGFFLFALISSAGNTQKAPTEPVITPSSTIIASSSPSPAPSLSPSPSPSSNPSLVTVTEVVDGDTIVIEGGQAVRYIGMDTPETKHPTKSVQCFGVEASERNKELVEGKQVRLEKDVSETDKYGRLLRYVYVGDEMINEKLVQEGYATAVSYPPDVKYQDKLRTAEREARTSKAGLWTECKTVAPSPTSVTTPKPQNPIFLN
jgi:micrococcal nuclease